MLKKYFVGSLFFGLLVLSFDVSANSGLTFAGKKNTIPHEVPNEEFYLKLGSDIQQYAKKFVGIRYKRAGKSTKGFDCSGFVGYVFKKFDVKLGACSTEMFRLGYHVSTDESLPGDLIFFKRSKNSKSGISHVGIVLESSNKGLKFIHAASSRGITISHLRDPYYSAHFVGVKRVINTSAVSKRKNNAL